MAGIKLFVLAMVLIIMSSTLLVNSYPAPNHGRKNHKQAIDDVSDYPEQEKACLKKCMGGVLTLPRVEKCRKACSFQAGPWSWAPRGK